MKNNQYYVYLFVLLFLVLLNAALFSHITGLAVLLYAGVVVFSAGLIILIYFFSKKSLPPAGDPQQGPYSAPSPGADASNLEKEVLIENLQSRTMQNIVQPDFQLHKRIIFLELILIFILLFLLIIRRTL